MTFVGGGGRNVALASIAGRLRAQGADHDAIYAHLMICPERQGLPESEVRAIARSISQKPPGVPRAQLLGRRFRDALEEWCAHRGLAESAALAFGAFAKGREVWTPERDGAGRIVNHARRRGDNTAFNHGGKGSCEKGKPRGLAMTWPPDPAGVPMIVEGLPDGVAARTALPGLSVIVKPQAKLSAQCEGWLQSLCAGRAGSTVLLVPDPKPVELAGAEYTAKALAMAGARVRFIPPLPEMDLDKRLHRIAESERGAHLQALIDGALEWKPGTWPTNAELKRRVQVVVAATPSKPPGDSGAPVEVVAEVVEGGGDDLPEVQLGPDQGRVGDEVLAILARRDSTLFRRGGELVQLVPGDAVNPARLAPLAEPAMRERITRMMVLLNHKGERAHPPRWLAENLLARGSWPGVRQCVGVTESPTMRPDGSILDQPGFDAATGLYLAPRGTFPPIPDRPSLDDAQAAAARLLGLICDFPSKGPEHKCAWLLSVLVLACRSAFDGPTPLFAVTGNVRGCGKSKLATLASIIGTGRLPALGAYPSTNDEMNKTLVALVDAGAAVIVFDNVGVPVGGDCLDLALTTGMFTGRRLGQSAMVTRPFNSVVFTTGNNMQLRGDTSRRVLLIELESPDAKPEERPPDSFKFPDVVGEALANRPAYLADALTIVRGYIAAGRPKTSARSLGSFEAMCALLGNSLVWCGVGDPLDSRLLMSDDMDPDTCFLEAAMAAIERLDVDRRGVTAVALLDDQDSAWKATLGDTFGQVNANRLGAKLNRLRGRFDTRGRRIQRRKVGGTTRWSVAG